MKKIGVIGLGKMGSQIAIRLKRNDFEVFGTDVNESSRTALSEDITVLSNREELISHLGDEPVVWFNDQHHCAWCIRESTTWRYIWRKCCCS